MDGVCLGIVGTGVMGRGIAQVAAAAGNRVLLYDARPGAAAEARAALADTFARLAEKGKLADPDAAAARLEVVETVAGLAPAKLVVEAIVERVDAKQALLTELEAVVGDDCILASNTSSLSVAAIAAACRLPGRVAGFHFFNPVPLMKVVEVIDAPLTEPWVGETLAALARGFGHTPVRAKDTPGFIVNHASRGYGPEALKILGECIAEPHDVDRILREAAGFRMGPFELFDLTGLDVSQPVMEAIYEQYYHEPRYRPSPIGRQRLAAGLLGRKSGRGFYRYQDGKPVVPPTPPVPSARPASVWVAPGAEAVARLAFDQGAKVESGERPSEAALCVVAPLGVDAAYEAARLGLDPRRVVAVDPLFLERHRTVMLTPATAPAFADAAHALFAPATVVADSVGCVAQRVVAMLVNVGCDIAQQGIASPADIDRAVTLGLGYPKGPLAWGDALGPATVLVVLEGMLALTGDPRYRPSPWLRRRATLGLSLLA